MTQILKKEGRIIFLIICLALFIRILYSASYPTVIVLPDTYGYYNVGVEMITTKRIVHDFRTPLYPLILNLTTYLSGNFKTPILSPLFFQTMNSVILLQSLFGLVQLFFFYLILRLLGFRKIVSFFFTLFIGFDVNIFGWERMLTPESLTLFFLTISTFFSLRAIKNPSLLSFIGLFLSFLALFAIKPVYALFPFPVLLGISLSRRKKDVMVKSLILFILFSCLIVGYVYLNKKHFNYQGISRASDINLFGKILSFRFAANVKYDGLYFSEKVNTYLTQQKDPNPYRFFEYFNFAEEKKQDVFNKLPSFNRSVIGRNIIPFTIKSITQIPFTLTEEDTILPSSHKSPTLFFFLHTFYTYCQYINLIVLIAFPFIVIQKRFVLLGIIVFYQIFSSVFFSYGEFARLLMVVQPYLFVLSFYTLSTLSRKAFQSHQ